MRAVGSAALVIVALLENRDVINQTDHHYSRSSVARAMIARDAEAGRIDGVELRRIGYAVALHAKERGRNG